VIRRAIVRCILDGWEREFPLCLATSSVTDDEHLRLEAEAPDIVALALLEHDSSGATASSDELEITQTRWGFGHILRFLQAAVLTGDDRIMVEGMRWLTDVLVTRDVPRTVVAGMIGAIGRVLSPSLVRSHGCLDRAGASLGA
jgi:hypothetical protein